MDKQKAPNPIRVNPEGARPVGANPPKRPIYLEPDASPREHLVGANPSRRFMRRFLRSKETEETVVILPSKIRSSGTRSSPTSPSGTLSPGIPATGAVPRRIPVAATPTIGTQSTGTPAVKTRSPGTPTTRIPVTAVSPAAVVGTQSTGASAVKTQPPGTPTTGIPGTAVAPATVVGTQSTGAPAIKTQPPGTPTTGIPGTAIAPTAVVGTQSTGTPAVKTRPPGTPTTGIPVTAVAPAAVVGTQSTGTPAVKTRPPSTPTTGIPVTAVAPAAVSPFIVHAETRSTGAIEDGTLDVMTICKDESGQIVCPGSTGSNKGFSIISWLKSDRDMPLPFYADLGKKSNDVFGKGYHFGIYKLDLKTKSEAGVEFTSGITSNHESGKVFGSLSSKYAVKDYGLSFTEKWNTDNTLATDITIQDKIAAGLKVTLEGTFAPQTGAKSGKLKTAFANTTVAVNTSLDLDLAGPIVDVAVVLGQKGWLAGFQSQFDTQKTKFTKNNFTLGYQAEKFELNTNVDNGTDFGGSIYQKVSDKLDCGINMKWTAGSADTLFGVGVKHTLDGDASLHAKINNKSLIGLGYQQKLRPGVVITLSAAIDGQNFNAGGHKVGIALELEP